MNTTFHNIKHLAIIMDGNARWAIENNLSTAQGHERGADNVKTILSAAVELQIPYLSIYAFSSENWMRSREEIEILMNLLSFHLEKEVNSLIKNGIKLKVIGKLSTLDIKLQEKITNIEKLTQNNEKIVFCIAFSYGGKNEILDACNNLIKLGKVPVNETDLRQNFYDPEMPDVDLLVRTSGVYRISNFLLWQAAYAELYFSKKKLAGF